MGSAGGCGLFGLGLSPGSSQDRQDSQDYEQNEARNSECRITVQAGHGRSPLEMYASLRRGRDGRPVVDGGLSSFVFVGEQAAVRDGALSMRRFLHVARKGQMVLGVTSDDRSTRQRGSASKRSIPSASEMSRTSITGSCWAGS